MKASLAAAFEGACHCGAIGFTYRTLVRPDEWSVRACQCSFCRAHMAFTTSDPSGSLEFFEHSAGALNRYRFGQRTADFLVCRSCGVYLGAVISTARGRFGIVNAAVLRDAPVELPAAVAMNYGSETAEERIARREQRWTPVVGVV
jgi:hypothetical protein